MNYLWVAVGSALGGMGRYACSGLGARYMGDSFPWGTLFVNVLGSLIIGILAAVIPAESRLLANNAREFLMIGLCGGFTTFSAFSLETMNLAKNGQWGPASAYVSGSIVLCLAAVSIGYFLATTLTR